MAYGARGIHLLLAHLVIGFVFRVRIFPVVVLAVVVFKMGSHSFLPVHRGCDLGSANSYSTKCVVFVFRAYPTQRFLGYLFIEGSHNSGGLPAWVTSCKPSGTAEYIEIAIGKLSRRFLVLDLVNDKRAICSHKSIVLRAVDNCKRIIANYGLSKR